MQISTPPEDAAVTPPAGVSLIRARNAGPLTLGGTNTWVLGGRAADATIVIDPGPALPDHLAAILATGQPTAIILTHQHADHSEAAADLAEEWGIPVHAALAELSVAAAPLADGHVIAAAGWEVTVLSTPGHTSDSVCLAIDGALFTGDTLLGGSTTVIAPPSGSLWAYFETMIRLGELTGVTGLPGHGPAFSSVGGWARHNAAHREARLAQLAEIFARVSIRPRDANDAAVLSEVASAAYGQPGTPVAPYIESMVAAQLLYLRERGDISA